MTSLRDRLRAGDPAAGEPGLDATDLARMRQLIVSSSVRPRRRGLTLAAPLAAALLCATAGSAWFIQFSEPDDDAAEVALPRQRQLQFATPGGTRVIWFFNPDFDVR